MAHQLAIDLVGREQVVAPALVLVAHRHPAVGDHGRRAFDRGRRVLAQDELGARVARRLQPQLRRMQFARTGDVEVEIEARGRVNPGGEHVVVIAGPGDLATANRTPLLLEGEQVGQHLAGMRLFGEAVDDRNGGAGRHLPHVVLTQDSDDDPLDVARQHPGCVGDGFAAAELHFGAGQHDRLAAELAHADVERHAGAGRGPVKNHRQSLAGQRSRDGL